MTAANTRSSFTPNGGAPVTSSGARRSDGLAVVR
jgi:hypothetical protein